MKEQDTKRNADHNEVQSQNANLSFLYHFCCHWLQFKENIAYLARAWDQVRDASLEKKKGF